MAYRAIGLTGMQAFTKKMTANTYEILHQAEEGIFYVTLDEGQRAFMKYEKSQNAAEVDFFSTFVPDNHRGKGLAAQLVEHGFAWAEEQQFSIKTSCWYAERKRQRMMRKKG